MYPSPTGWFYMGTTGPIQRSKDLISWFALDKTPALVGGGLVGDGQRLFAASRQTVTEVVSPEADGATWQPLSPPHVTQGANIFTYDPVHHILYANHQKDGLWRIVTQ
jgi:hypothetical protein